MAVKPVGSVTVVSLSVNVATTPVNARPAVGAIGFAVTAIVGLATVVVA